MNDRVIFVSDVHLAPSQTALELAWLRFVAAMLAHPPRALYLLGDIFDIWIGDDAAQYSATAAVDNSLRQLGAATQVTWLGGNRDFLLGDAMTKKWGITHSHSDVLECSIGDQHLRLLHGDTLCLDDHQYQALRQQLRAPAWQGQFLNLPVELRIQKAQAIRTESHTQQGQKSMTSMDATPSAVRKIAQGVSHVVFGHTHQPAQSVLEQTHITVLGAWDAQGGQYAQWSQGRMQLMQSP